MNERLTEEDFCLRDRKDARKLIRALATAEADLAAAREMGERECERAEHWFREWEAANADAEQARWEVELMTAQRDEAFKHLTKEQQRECIRAACRTVQPQTLELLASQAHEQRVGKEGGTLPAVEKPGASCQADPAPENIPQP